MRNLTGRLMEEKLKIGWTIEDFIKYFNCNEEEFLQNLQKQFREKAYKDMLTRLNKNAKRRERSMKPVKRILSNIVAESQKSEIILNEITSECKVEEKVTTESILDELNCKENEIRQLICGKECLRNDLISEKRKLMNFLQDKKDEMIKLKSQIEQSEKEIDKAIEGLNNVSVKFEQVKAEIDEFHEMLIEIQKQIKELEKFNLYAYSDGAIESDEGEIEIPDEWEENFIKLTKNSIVEDLTVKQIKQLSKIIVLSKELLEKDKKFEITFEVEKVQEAYHQLMVAG